MNQRSCISYINYFYKTFWEQAKLICGDRDQITVAKGTSWGGGNVLHLTGVVVTKVHVFSKTRPTVHLRSACFIIYKVHLNFFKEGEKKTQQYFLPLFSNLKKFAYHRKLLAPT